MSPKLRLIIRSREELLYDQEVASVSSRNEKGNFDILPLHANFITSVSSPLIVRKIGGEKEEIDVKSSILRVKNNVIQVFVGLGENS